VVDPEPVVALEVETVQGAGIVQEVGTGLVSGVVLYRIEVLGWFGIVKGKGFVILQSFGIEKEIGLVITLGIVM
jgi:hypothetical protein